MLRVKDIEKSLKFYQDTLGMTLIRKHEAEAAGFNLYFLAYPADQGLPSDEKTSHREGLLELTWNYGTEKDEAFKYHNGNDQPQGFGHICELGPLKRKCKPQRWTKKTRVKRCMLTLNQRHFGG